MEFEREKSYSIPIELEDLKIVDWIQNLQESIAHAFHDPGRPNREQDAEHTPPAVVDHICERSKL
ncbi:MAG: hypothetical protein ACI9UA_002838 [Pseudoalteromonas tetraodonis]|jgi:hypothetical protein